MDTIQKAILISLISIAAISWVFSNYQPDMMKAMMTYDPIAVSLFTISWTVGMAAMYIYYLGGRPERQWKYKVT